MHSNRSGLMDWPLTNSEIWPGELALTCPVCKSQDVALRTRPIDRARTAFIDTNSCNYCGHVDTRIREATNTNSIATK